MTNNYSKVKKYVSSVNPEHINTTQFSEVDVVVVLPVYNEERFVENFLLKLNSQIYKNFEVIVVDNGCTDKTIHIAYDFLDKVNYPIYIISETKPGPGNARKRGMDEAVYRLYKSGKLNKGIIVTTDADTTPLSSWLSDIKHGFCSPNIGGLAGTHIASDFINKKIEDNLNLKNYFNNANQLIVYLRDNNYGNIKMSGPNSSFSAYVYCEVGGIEQPYIGSKVDIKEIKLLQNKIIKAGYTVAPLDTPIIANQRRHLYELIHGGLHANYLSNSTDERFITIRDSEDVLLDTALKKVPLPDWLSYHNKIVTSILKNVVWDSINDDKLPLEGLINKLDLSVQLEEKYDFDWFFNNIGTRLLKKSGVPFYPL